MNETNQPQTPAGLPNLTRRNFVRSAVITGAATTFVSGTKAFSAERSDQIAVALIGCGAQGQVLLNSCKSLAATGAIKFVAICDIWDYKRNEVKNKMKALGQNPVEYTDIDELLAKETSVQVCLVAVPDFLHAPFSNKVVDSGRHVYCEKMMSNTIEAAKSMVEAQKRTGKLYQIGHQRRSSPRYIDMKKNVVFGDKLLGQVTHAYAQWNRAVTSPIAVNKSAAISQDLLAKFGYDSMEHFLNWRWYKKYGGGPISDLGAHQIDMFNWLFNGPPVSVTACGGRDYYDGSKGRGNFEHNDNNLLIYEYNVEGSIVRLAYTVLTTTSSQGIFEKVMGDQGSVVIGENGNNNQVYRENTATWDADAMVAKGVLAPFAGAVHHKFWEKPRPWYQAEKWLDKGIVDARESKPAGAFELPTMLNKPPHTPHLENFFETVRKNGKQDDLNCPVLDAYRSCVTVLRAADAINEGKKIIFNPAEFTV